jgi:4-alpha-glucanotransferase
VSAPEHLEHLIDAALAELGVRRMLLAIHDSSFPCDPDEDLGRGTPASRATERLLPFVRALGFTGLQLGPQGQTSRDNPSPYDGTIFSRHTGGIAVRSFRRGGPYEGLIGERALDALLLAPPGGRARHARAYDATERLIDAAFAAVTAGARPELRPELDRFVAAHGAAWLEADARYAAYARRFGGIASRHWPAELRDPQSALEATVDPELGEQMRRYELGQWLAHAEHARFRDAVRRAGLVLYGDLQIGLADADLWAHRAAFLADYVMGAPPSRTNPEGQPWGYAVLDPAQLEEGGPALRLFLARIEKAFEEHDALRIDHPHGLVCPWVYRADAGDPAVAVREGARLHEAPDLPDHPALARFAIARPDQIDRARPRYHDSWVRELEEGQVARYALLFDVIAGVAVGRGRSVADLSCEVLSTMPLPLGRVLAHYGLGRWRVTQKADLGDPTDVYRTENAAPADWVMLGNHDTRPIFELVRQMPAEDRARWARHLAGRLALGEGGAGALAAEPGRLATAMLGELFLSAAENVSIFFADLFGYEERYNVPGVVSDENWSLRLPADFERLYGERVDRGAALDVREALALALDGRGSASGLAARLRGG